MGRERKERMRTKQDPTTNEIGDEIHPAYALIGATRVTFTSGVALFDSDIIHQKSIRIRIRGASRKRALHCDWIHGEKEYIEVELSEAQWASFVSSMNGGDGVPCTLRYRNGEMIPEFPHDPRLGRAIQETKDAASLAFKNIKDAMAEYESLDPKAGIKERRSALSKLHHTIANADRNVEFAGKSLVEFTENVVQKARADVEAFVVTKARQLGLETSDLGSPLAIGGTDETA